MSIQIQDGTETLSAADRAALSSKAGSWPFDVHLLIQNAPSRDSLDDSVHAAVTGPHVVAIGVDPAHHHVVAHFGTGTGVKPGDFDSIAKAGNSHFRSHEWVGGIEAIAVRAQASAQAHVAMSASAEPVVIEQGLGTGAWCGIALLFAAVVACVMWLVRRSRRDRDSFESALRDSQEQTSELRTRNIEEGSWMNRLKTGASQRPAPTSSSPPPYSTSVYAPAPPVIVHDNSGDLLTGVLIGEAMSDRSPRVIEREVIRETPSYSRDSGGSDSSWSGSSSSYDSSSSDSGGSSSSWDSGGSSFDSGGGGFDSGGGGGDW